MQKLKFFLLIGLFLLPILALGADITLVEINPNIPPGNSANDPGSIVSNFYQFALIFSGVLAFIVIIWAGIKYAIAAGNPSGQSDAKQWIYSALIGLLLLSGGGIILNIINKNTFKIENGVLVVPGINSLKQVEKIEEDNNSNNTEQPNDNQNQNACIGATNGTPCANEECAPLMVNAPIQCACAYKH